MGLRDVCGCACVRARGRGRRGEAHRLMDALQRRKPIRLRHLPTRSPKSFAAAHRPPSRQSSGTRRRRADDAPSPRGRRKPSRYSGPAVQQQLRPPTPTRAGPTSKAATVEGAAARSDGWAELAGGVRSGVRSGTIRCSWKTAMTCVSCSCSATNRPPHLPMRACSPWRRVGGASGAVRSCVQGRAVRRAG